MNNRDEPLTAVDAIRCVYLARMCRKRGDHEAARRWQAKADAWLRRQNPAAGPDPRVTPGQLIPEPSSTTHTP